MVNEKIGAVAAITVIIFMAAVFAFPSKSTTPSTTYPIVPEPVFTGIIVGQAFDQLIMTPLPNATVRIFNECPHFNQPITPLWGGVTDMNGSFRTDTPLQIFGNPCYQLEKTGYYTSTAGTTLQPVSDGMYRFVASTVKKSTNWKMFATSYNGTVIKHDNVVALAGSADTTISITFLNNDPYTSLGGIAEQGNYLAVSIMTNMQITSPKQIIQNPYLGGIYPLSNPLYSISPLFPTKTVTVTFSFHTTSCCSASPSPINIYVVEITSTNITLLWQLSFIIQVY